eukprot:Nk52_evm22s359 gene=Nk52_evmTU22s359
MNADEIRLKRLARLGNPSATSSESEDGAGTSPGKMDNAGSGLGRTATDMTVDYHPEGKVAGSAAVVDTVMKEVGPAPVAEQKRVATIVVDREDLLKGFTHEFVCRNLQVRLRESETVMGGEDMSRAAVLNTVRTELAEERGVGEENVQIGVDDIDRVLLSRLSEGLLAVPVLEYLLACYQRVLQDERFIPRSLQEGMVKCVSSLKALCISYSGLVLQMPDVFPQPQTKESLGPQQLVKHLYAPMDSPQCLPGGFLSQLVERFENDGLEAIFEPILTLMFQEMAVKNIDDPFMQPLSVLSELINFPAVAKLLINHPYFLNTSVAGKDIERKLILGPFFNISTLDLKDGRVMSHFRGNNLNQPSASTQSTILSYRGTLNGLHKCLHDIMLKLLKTPGERENILKFFAFVLNTNRKRSQSHADRAQNASDGFFVNFSCCLLKLCDPFMQPIQQKYAKIDIDYLSKPCCKLDLSDETRMRMNKEQLEERLKQFSSDQSSANFVTECFFFTAYSLHLGIKPTIDFFMRMLKDYSHTNDRRRALEAQMGANQQAREMAQRRIDANLNMLSMGKLAYEVIVGDGDTIKHILEFYNFVSGWLVNIINPEKKSLPLEGEPQGQFAALPEFLAEDIADFLAFVANSRHSMDESNMNELLEFTVTVLSCPDYIKNPYLKSKLVETIYVMSPEVQGRLTGFYSLVLDHPLAVNCLAHALMTFFIECESMGGSNQFYDKFNVRYHLAIIMKNLWENENHRKGMLKDSEEGQFFVKFINLLMNDTTFLLDESLTQLTEIRDIQLLMKDPSQWNALSEEDKQQKQQTLSSNERMCKTFLLMANETINIFHYMSKVIQGPFLRPELIERLAAMLDYNLVMLAGPTCQSLKVENPERYKFQPRVLLSQITDIFTFLCGITSATSEGTAFIGAIASDGRSYKKEVFEKAANILRKFSLKSDNDIAKFERLAALVEQKRVNDCNEEEELGDIPDEYLDPLMFTLMKDPVLLPTSGMTIDRATIVSHLLSDATDPFNRKPLSIEMVEDNIALREEIDDWVKTKLKK